MSFVNALAKALTTACTTTGTGCPLSDTGINTECYEEGSCTFHHDCLQVVEEDWLKMLLVPPADDCKHTKVCKYKE